MVAQVSWRPCSTVWTFAGEGSEAIAALGRAFGGLPTILNRESLPVLRVMAAVAAGCALYEQLIDAIENCDEIELRYDA